MKYGPHIPLSDPRFKTKFGIYEEWYNDYQAIEFIDEDEHFVLLGVTNPTKDRPTPCAKVLTKNGNVGWIGFNSYWFELVPFEENNEENNIVQRCTQPT